MTTVFVVMQAQSGMVLAKSFYRFCGTMGRSHRDAHAHQPVFATVGVVSLGDSAVGRHRTAGAAHNRNFRSYGFVLMSVALVPALMFGAFLSTRRADGRQHGLLHLLSAFWQDRTISCI